MDNEPWGTYKPFGMAGFVLWLTSLRIGRGRIKKILQKIWLAGDFGTVADIIKFGVK